MEVTELFFGRDIEGRAPLTGEEWADFAAKVLSPNFPDGFTVYDAEGQWLDKATNKIVREPSKVVIIAAEESPDLVKRIDAVTDAYRKRFHQMSVGVISEPVCASF